MTTAIVRLILPTCLCLLFAGGCAGPSDPRQPATSPSAAAVNHCPHSECVVCKYNADLACIDVEVDKTTPAYAYNGKTYYFCSKECRDNFAKNPARYLANK